MKVKTITTRLPAETTKKNKQQTLVSRRKKGMVFHEDVILQRHGGLMHSKALGKPDQKYG